MAQRQMKQRPHHMLASVLSAQQPAPEARPRLPGMMVHGIADSLKRMPQPQRPQPHGLSAHFGGDVPPALLWLNSNSKWVASVGFFGTIARSRTTHAGWAGAGVIAVSYAAKILKWFLRRPRPLGSRKKDPGMPSNHATGFMYCAVYAVLECARARKLRRRRPTPFPQSQSQQNIQQQQQIGEETQQPQQSQQQPTSQQLPPPQRSHQRQVSLPARLDGSQEAALEAIAPLQRGVMAKAAEELVQLALPGSIVAATALACWLRVACGQHSAGQVMAGALLGGATAAVWRALGLYVAEPLLKKRPEPRVVMWTLVIGSFARFFAQGLRKTLVKP